MLGKPAAEWLGLEQTKKDKVRRFGIACPAQPPAGPMGATSHLEPPYELEAAECAALGAMAQPPRFKGWEWHRPCRPV